MLSLVLEGSDAKQWSEWLRVPLEYALATGNVELAGDLLDAGADGSAGWSGFVVAPSSSQRWRVEARVR